MSDAKRNRAPEQPEETSSGASGGGSIGNTPPPGSPTGGRDESGRRGPHEPRPKPNEAGRDAQGAV